MTNKKNEPRRYQILSVLKKHKKRSYSQLEEELFLSRSTLRREILLLEQEGLIRRYRGGVLLELEHAHEVPTSFRQTILTSEKKVIAEIASVFFGPGMCIFIDSSSTAKMLAPYIAKLPRIIVITNGLHTASDLSNICTADSKVFMIGGEVIKDADSVVGDYGWSFLDFFHIDLCCFSAARLDTKGVYEINFTQAMFKKKLLHLADQNLLLVDHSKFDQKESYKLSDLSAFDCIITDKEPSDKYLELGKTLNIEFLYP